MLTSYDSYSAKCKQLLIKLKVRNLEEFSFNPSSLSLSLYLSLSRNVSYTFQDKLLFSGCTKIRTHIKKRQNRIFFFVRYMQRRNNVFFVSCSVLNLPVIEQLVTQSYLSRGGLSLVKLVVLDICCKRKPRYFAVVISSYRFFLTLISQIIITITTIN